MPWRHGQLLQRPGLALLEQEQDLQQQQQLLHLPGLFLHLLWLPWFSVTTWQQG
jgi:hypothetical protein